jgi:hypothetical protein
VAPYHAITLGVIIHYMKMAPGSNIQMRLLEAEALAPLPVDSSHYVAVLQNKTGELSALRHASDQVWERMTPLLEFVGPKTAKNPLTATSVDGWVKRANDALGCRPLYIDILRLDPSTSVQHKNGVSMPVLDYIYGAARTRRMRFVPVLRVSEATEDRVESVQAAVASDGHGVGLRYRILEVLPPPGRTHRAVLEAQLESLKQTPQDCDLLIDLEYIDEDRDIDANLLAGHLAMMLAVGAWRSVVILGTSIPKMMGAIKEGTVGTIPRREWELWLELRLLGMDRLPAFGDYAVQHPHPPYDATGGAQGRANIRYTAARETVVARGVGPITQQEGNEHYQALCRQIVDRPEFAGRDYSWGDETIQDCADELVEPGSRNAWRGAGTSHHIQLVTDGLRPGVSAS